MNNYKGISGGLYLVTEWIMKFSLANVYWLLFNIPIMVVLLFASLTDPADGILLFLILIAFMVPPVFFPATSALFALVREYIIKESTPNNIFKSYLTYYKENYKRSVLGGLILTPIWVIWIADIYYLFEINAVFFYMLLALGMILYVFTINFFSVTVHYYFSFKTSFKNTFLITLSSPILFLAIAISSGVILYISIGMVRFLLVFFTFTLIAFFAFAAFYRNYLKGNKREE